RRARQPIRRQLPSLRDNLCRARTGWLSWLRSFHNLTKSSSPAFGQSGSVALPQNLSRLSQDKSRLGGDFSDDAMRHAIKRGAQVTIGRHLDQRRADEFAEPQAVPSDLVVAA